MRKGFHGDTLTHGGREFELIDQPLEAFVSTKLAGDDPRRADLHDAIAAARIETRRLGVEGSAGELGERTLGERARGAGIAEEVEVVVLRTAGAGACRPGRRCADRGVRARRLRDGQQ